MATSSMTTESATDPGTRLDAFPEPVRLDQRFAALKREIIRPEDEAALSSSYERLKEALSAEVERLSNLQQAAIPEVEWADIKANGGRIPKDIAEKARHAGCVLFRGVVSEEQALSWKKELMEYTTKHRAVGGRPLSNPTFWLLYWTRPQVQMRSHPEVLQAMNAVMKLWHIDDGDLPIDMESQVVYADRFRIRKAGDKEYTLKAHLDSSAIERWEDPKYRSNYEAIFRGNWEDYDPWRMDNRPDAKVDLYRQRGSCSAFRAMQGWLSLSDCGPGEGTLRLLPSLQMSMAYIMLRPFFLQEKLDVTQSTFPGASPGNGQLYPTAKFHPHLQLDKSVISVPKVRPGDYMFWHADLVHEVEDQHNGKLDSTVFYNASVPLCPYNIENMRRMLKSFRDVEPPADFYLDMGGPFEVEAKHEDHGAREENILSLEGRRALGLESFDEHESGISEGQSRVRKMANEAMRLPDD
ncbi:hypothetical protein H2201_002464 [Coniosporium apollinis]|uniref:DUF1479 domain protein n=1 Tax=Coniosporium apollinis TaxID=61459 RepID=A0ABQ9NZU5_9PEZI|nr:hypothetical protein H2201_002464 [Coniosporium apollinis]